MRGFSAHGSVTVFQQAKMEAVIQEENRTKVEVFWRLRLRLFCLHKVQRMFGDKGHSRHYKHAYLTDLVTDVFGKHPYVDAVESRHIILLEPLGE